MIESDWYGLYSEQWVNDIVPDGISHPAKYSRALIRKIYQHLHEEGWVAPGDTILDPFGGVACGALDAMHRGLNWIGIELEKRFVRVGNETGYECPGMTKAEWVRWQHRLGRNDDICPECRRALVYVRNSGIIPTTTPHHFTSNIEYWNKKYAIFGEKWGSARLIQGDSRKITDALHNAEVALSSPPYAGSDVKATHMTSAARVDPADPHYRPSWVGKFESGYNDIRRPYGDTPGQLGDLPEGDIDAAIGSPPFLQSSGGVNITSQTGILSDPRLIARHSAGNKGLGGYGVSDGQLEQLPEGSFTAALSSPPYAETRLGEETGFTQAGHNKAYGGTDGQLGRFKDEGLDAAVSSPPYGGAGETQVAAYDGSQGDKYRETGKSPRARSQDGKLPSENYNLQSGDNLGSSETDDFWSAARGIVDQLFTVIRPGGHAVWVVKAYVKNKQYIDFPDQWRRLCEAAGFETEHIHRAWVIEDKGTQLDLFGGHVKTTVERKSFFRRLAETKGSPRIDYEVVICMRRP